MQQRLVVIGDSPEIRSVARAVLETGDFDLVQAHEEQDGNLLTGATDMCLVLFDVPTAGRAGCDIFGDVIDLCLGRTRELALRFGAATSCFLGDHQPAST